jgi:hypothetical protein
MDRSIGRLNTASVSDASVRVRVVRIAINAHLLV